MPRRRPLGEFDSGDLSELSQGCIGSHTEQPCTLEGVAYIRVGGDDAATLFFHDDGALAAVRRVGDGDDTCEDAWYGLDLSACEATGDEEAVSCDGAGSEWGCPGPITRRAARPPSARG